MSSMMFEYKDIELENIPQIVFADAHESEIFRAHHNHPK